MMLNNKELFALGPSLLLSWWHASRFNLRGRNCLCGRFSVANGYVELEAISSHCSRLLFRQSLGFTPSSTEGSLSVDLQRVSLYKAVLMSTEW